MPPISLDSMLTLDELNTLVLRAYGPQEPERSAWEHADDEARTRAAEQATAVWRELRWRGRVAAVDQAYPWPRYETGTSTYVGLTAVEQESGEDAWSVPNVPMAIRRGLAMFAGVCAAVEAGLMDQSLAGLAAAGVSAHSAGGVSVGIDLRRADAAWALLTPRIRNIVGPYRAVGGELA